MKMEITKTYRFEAAHSLPHLPDGHKCKGVHGHSYEILIGVKGELVPRLDWVQDYAEISDHVKPLVAQLDHQNLNEILAGITTVENLALWFAERLAPDLPLLSRIEVRETPTSNVILLIENASKDGTP